MYTFTTSQLIEILANTCQLFVSHLSVYGASGDEARVLTITEMMVRVGLDQNIPFTGESNPTSEDGDNISPEALGLNEPF